jgi:hypothetical protein
MLDWHVKSFRNGESQGRPLTFSSPQAAIDAANSGLKDGTADEVVVYHRLYSDQAFLKFSSTIAECDVLANAAHLEQQARRASHSG